MMMVLVAAAALHFQPFDFAKRNCFFLFFGIFSFYFLLLICIHYIHFKVALVLLSFFLAWWI